MRKTYWLCTTGRTGYTWYVSDSKAQHTINSTAPLSHRAAFTYLQMLRLCAKHPALFAEKIHS